MMPQVLVAAGYQFFLSYLQSFMHFQSALGSYCIQLAWERA